jgi:hypothetical protein
MSLHEYRAAVALWKSDPPFYALIMAAMYRADSTNAAKLAEAFPEVWDEVNARYHAPGGVLEGEPVPA